MHDSYSVRVVAVIMVIKVLMCEGSDCIDTYRDSVNDHKGKFRACFNTTRVLALGNVLRNDSNFRGTEANCFDTCLSIGLNEISIGKEVRSPGDGILAMFSENPDQPEKYCACVMDYPGHTHSESCSEDYTRWDIPLHCAGVSGDECNQMLNCEYSSQCCYFKGTIPEHPLWKASRIVLQWVFLSVAMVFIIQVIIYSIFKVRGSSRRRFGYGGDLSTGMLAASAEQYHTMLEALPPATISPGDTGTACTICLEDLSAPAGSGEESGAKPGGCVSLPSCGHTFHLSCIKTYATHEAAKLRVALCPNCRAHILAEEGEQEETAEEQQQQQQQPQHDAADGRPRDEAHAIELQDIQ